MESVAKSMESINFSIISVLHVKLAVNNGITFKLKEDHVDQIKKYDFYTFFSEILSNMKLKKYLTYK